MDCLRAVLAAIYDDQRETDKIYAHIMEEIESCAPHSNLESVAADMLKKGRSRRPVVSGGGLIGGNLQTNTVCDLPSRLGRDGFIAIPNRFD